MFFLETFAVSVFKLPNENSAYGIEHGILEWSALWYSQTPIWCTYCLIFLYFVVPKSALSSQGYLIIDVLAVPLRAEPRASHLLVDHFAATLHRQSPHYSGYLHRLIECVSWIRGISLSPLFLPFWLSTPFCRSAGMLGEGLYPPAEPCPASVDLMTDWQICVLHITSFFQSFFSLPLGGPGTCFLSPSAPVILCAEVTPALYLWTLHGENLVSGQIL